MVVPSSSCMPCPSAGLRQDIGEDQKRQSFELVIGYDESVKRPVRKETENERTLTKCDGPSEHCSLWH